MLLNITLNELFAGERIAPENIEKKSEENLIGIATELQKKDHKIVLLKYFTAIIALVASATSISVGGISFEGTPVFSNLLLTILVICTWGALMYFTQKDRCTQRVALIINMVSGYFPPTRPIAPVSDPSPGEEDIPPDKAAGPPPE